MNTEITRGVLALAVALSVGVCLYLLFVIPMPQTSHDLILVIIGAMVATFKDIISYYFGSSDGSKKKTDLLLKGEGK